MNESKHLKQLMEDVSSEMGRLGYSASSIQHYRVVWNKYLKQTSFAGIDRKDMDQFLFECYGIAASTNHPTRYQRTAIRAMNVLAYYSEFKKIYIRFPIRKMLNAQTPFDSVLFGFIAALKESGLADSTIHTHERVVARFLRFLRDDSVNSLRDVSTVHVASFILEITGHRGKASYELASLRIFFRHLYNSGLHENDLALFVPASNKLKTREHLPSVWDTDDVQAILKCIDTGNPVGKRDYAIILLAVQLGLRGSDIKGIKFRDIDWRWWSAATQRGGWSKTRFRNRFTSST